MTNTRCKHTLRRLAAMLLCLALLLSLAPAVLAADMPDYASREYVVSQFVQSVGRNTMGTSDYLLSAFSDWEDIGAEYREDLSRAVNEGVLRGYSDGTLRPAEPIRRVEALVLFSRILPELEAVREPIAFSDVPAWAREDIDRLSAAGLVEGYGDGTLGSYDRITVEQVGLLTDRSDALLDRWMPGEDYFAYVNDKAFRNYVPAQPTVDAAHGVVSYDEVFINSFSMRYLEIEAQEDGLLQALGSGELSYEKGSPAQRIYDLCDCYLHEDEDIASDRAWLAGYAALLLEAETPAAFLDAWAAVFRKTGSYAPFGITAEADYDRAMAFPSLDVSEMLPAAILAFDAETEPKYRDALIGALAAFGETLDGDFTAADAEAAYELQKRLGAGTDYSGEYETLLNWLQYLGALPEGTDTEARLEAIRAQHPELCGEDADTRLHFLTLEEAAAIAADPLLDVPTLLRSTGYHDFAGVLISEPMIGVMKEARITEENLGAWKLTAMLCLFNKARLTLTDAQRDAMMRCAFFGYEGVFDGAYSYEEFSTWYLRQNQEAEQDFVSVARRLNEDYLYTDIGSLWCEYYYDPAITEEVRSMVEDLIQAYRTRFEALEWMDDETRAAAMRKLDAIIVNVGWEEGDEPEILSRAEGGTMLRNVCAISEKQHEYCCLLCADQDALRRSFINAPDAVNAIYVPGCNRVEVTPGILGGAFYTYGDDYAANLGRLGMAIGHEIGHAFDRLGSQHNESGTLENWWSEASAAVYESLADRFLTYYENYELLDGVQQDPNETVNESMADFAGMTMVMEILKDDPEAQRTALKTFAEMWLQIATPNWLKSYYLGNEHPAGYVRVNSIVSSLDAFYELYDISEDDPMYVAPEDRLQLW